VCFDSKPTFATPQCEGHAMCTSCAVSYVRGALGDATAQVQAAGIRCPMHGSGGCQGFVNSVDAVRLLKDRDAKRFALIVTGKPCQSKRCQVRFVVSVVEEMKRRTFDGRVGIQMAPGVVL
jgi:hypothetical protein